MLYLSPTGLSSAVVAFKFKAIAEGVMRQSPEAVWESRNLQKHQTKRFRRQCGPGAHFRAYQEREKKKKNLHLSQFKRGGHWNLSQEWVNFAFNLSFSF